MDLEAWVEAILLHEDLKEGDVVDWVYFLGVNLLFHRKLMFRSFSVAVLVSV
jgi:hypothetical protein